MSVFAAAAWAGNDNTKTIPVAASVTSNCVVTTGNTLDFGAYDPTSANAVAGTGDKPGSVNFTLKCTKNAGVVVGIDVGLHDNTGQRRLSDGQPTPSYLNYDLYQPGSGSVSGGTAACPGTTVWDNSSNKVSYSSASAATITVPVCGKIPGAQDVPAGSYTDTVTLYVAF